MSDRKPIEDLFDFPTGQPGAAGAGRARGKKSQQGELFSQSPQGDGHAASGDGAPQPESGAVADMPDAFEPFPEDSFDEEPVVEGASPESAAPVSRASHPPEPDDGPSDLWYEDERDGVASEAAEQEPGAISAEAHRRLEPVSTESVNPQPVATAPPAAPPSPSAAPLDAPQTQGKVYAEESPGLFDDNPDPYDDDLYDSVSGADAFDQGSLDASVDGSPAPTLGARWLSGAADVLLHLGVLALALGAMLWLDITPSLRLWPGFAAFLLSFSFLYVTLPLAFWGQTPGMAWAGLRAENADGLSLTFVQSVLRWGAAIVTAALLGLPLVVALSGLSLADRISGSQTARA